MILKTNAMYSIGRILKLFKNTHLQEAAYAPESRYFAPDCGVWHPKIKERGIYHD